MHSRPPLWNKFDPKYSDRVIKARLWEEIYRSIYFVWEEYSAVEKKKKGADVQKKWKNLKDTYFKEVAAEKKVVSGQARKKKKRPYIHMGALSFLSTQKSNRDTSNNMRDTESTTTNTEDLTNQSDDEDTDSEISRNKRLKTSMRKKTKNQNNTDDELLKLLQDKKYDEDVSFCEMIIPMLKNLSTEQKHYAKIEILNALNRANKYSQQNIRPLRVSSQSPYPNTPSPYPNTPSPYPNTPSPYPDTPSPYPNIIRQSPSTQIYQYPQSFAPSPPEPSLQTQYMPSRNPTITPQYQPDPSLQMRHTPSRNPIIISQSQPVPSPQIQNTSSPNPQSPPEPSLQTQYMPSHNPTITPQSQPDSSPQIRHTPSNNPIIISQSQPVPSPQTQSTSTPNTTINPQSQPDPDPQAQYTHDFPNTTFNHSSYVVEGSGFEMKDYILFK